jgi:predicted ATP-binding protein involved in virulence
MNITELHLRNFRCFQKSKFTFHRQFNLLIGENASGKSSLLEGLAVGIGSWFLGIRGYDSKTIDKSHVRVTPVVHLDTKQLERQYPVSVSCSGDVMGKSISWERELTGVGGSTTRTGATSIKQLAADAERRVRRGEPVDLPLIAYYSTKRLWVNPKDVEKATDAGSKQGGERLDGYFFSTDDRIHVKGILAWLRNQRYRSLESGRDSAAFSAVKQAIVNCSEGCRSAEYSVKEETLVLKFSGQDGLPFHLLSDGQRSMVAMLADIALKAVTLNPHLGDRGHSTTQGVVLIDEIDMHLHPRWQRNVVKSLKDAFPKLQFFATTHSPQIIRETPHDEIMVLKPDGTWDRPSQSIGLDSSEVLRYIMDTESINGDVAQELDRLDQLLADAEFEKARELISSIRCKYGELSRTSGAEAYMARMELLADNGAETP